MKNLLIFLLLFSIISSKVTYSQDISWEFANGPYGGVVNQLAVDDEGNIYAATVNGVYKSTNNGESWIQKNGEIKNFKPDYIAVSNGNLIAAISIDAVYYSTDKGESWMESTLADSSFISMLEINPYDNNAYITAGGGLYKSSNGGQSWANLGLYFFEAMTFLSNTEFLAITSGKVYRSINTGSNWAEVYSDWDIPDGTALCDIEIDADGNIYVAQQRGGIFKSTDDGNTWFQKNFGIFHTWVVALLVGSNGDIYCGTEDYGLYRTTNGGDMWVQINNGLVYGDWVWSIIQGQDNSIYASTIGVFKSTNNGDSWEEKDYLMDNVLVTSLQMTSSNKIFAAGNYGVFENTAGKNSWKNIDTGRVNLEILDFLITSDDIFYIGGFGGLYSSTDEGITLLSEADRLPELPFYTCSITEDKFKNLHTGILLYKDNRLRAAVCNRFYGDTTWIENQGSLILGYVNDFCDADSSCLFACGESNIFRSYNHGMNWEIASTDVNNKNFNTINYNAVTNSLFAGDRAGSIYRSINNGWNWENVFSTIEGSQIYDIQFNENGYVFAGSFGEGIFYSTDNGNTWSAINNGLKNLKVYALLFDEDGYLYAGTNGSVYKTEATTIVSVDDNINQSVPEEFELLQNYPNPFNPSTTIKFQIPNLVFPSWEGNGRGGLKTTLKIFDVLGREVATLVDEYLTAGEYTKEWNASNLPSGIYFCRMTAEGGAGNYKSNIKLLLLK